MKYITIATDVSCDPISKTSTWACYIRYDGGVIKQVKEFKTYYNDTVLAETYALVNALIIASSQISTWSESRVIIYNEIDRVLTPLRTKNGSLKLKELPRSEAIINYALPLLDKASSWERRKITAHYKDWQESDNPAKYAINRWCDIESRKLVKEIRKEKMQKCLRF